MPFRRKRVLNRNLEKGKKTPLDMSKINPQTASPLFNRIPAEIRNHIFFYAVTLHTDKKEAYPRNAFYYRPHFRYKYQELQTALLRTCRRIYQETQHLPALNYEAVEWYERGPQEHYICKPLLGLKYHPEMRSLHLFFQQFALEEWGSKAWLIGQEAVGLKVLKFTLRHSDWWWWEKSARLRLDAKQSGQASESRYSKASDDFEIGSWGRYFNYLHGLETFELELETVEGKRDELDEIVLRAADWRFPLGDGNALVMNRAKTKRTGWLGAKLCK